MNILDGNVYQMKSDGSIQNVHVTNRSIIAPFAMVTHFKPTIAVKIVIPGKDALFDILSKIVPGVHNLYLPMRVDGVFKSITVRTVGGQSWSLP
jgi:alpha-acetolactate decarboxylase